MHAQKGLKHDELLTIFVGFTVLLFVLFKWVHHEHYAKLFLLTSFLLNVHGVQLQLIIPPNKCEYILATSQGTIKLSNFPFGLGFLLATFVFVFGTLFGAKKSPFLTPFAQPNQRENYHQVVIWWVFT